MRPTLRRALRHTGLVLPPLALLALASLPPAAAQQPAPPAAAANAATDATATAPAPMPATAATAEPVRVRSGQHPDRGRVALNLGGAIPPYTLRRVGNDYEVRLRGAYRMDLSGLRRLTELNGAEMRQEGEDTVLLLRTNCDCTAEAGSSGGAIFIDLKRAPGAPPPAQNPNQNQQNTPPAGRAASPAPPPAPAARNAAPAGNAAQITEARRKLLDDAVRLGLMSQEQASTLLRQAPPPAPPAPAGGRNAATPPRDDLAELREAMLSRLALLNGAPAPAPTPAPAANGAGNGNGAPVPNPRFATPASAPQKPPCMGPPFTLNNWAGEQSFTEEVARRRAALALSDQGSAEMAALAEFYAAHELTREALDVLSVPLVEAPPPAVLLRLQRARDVARLLARQKIEPTSPLLAEMPDCTRPDLSLWRGLASAVEADPTTLSRLAPQIRATLRDVPLNMRMAFIGVMAEAVEEDAETLRTLVAPIRTASDLRPDQQILRSWLLARLARLEGNRADEVMHLERAATAGRTLPALQAQVRLAALNLTRPGAEGQRAELALMDFSRTYRQDPLGEEAAMLYGQRLLERGELTKALAVADTASQASQTGQRPSTESRGARLAAQALRLLLVDAKGLSLPPPGERLALYWQYEGYATPGERGDDIRQGAARLMLEQGLADAALETVRAFAPTTAQQPAGALLVARAEAAANQGDPQRALALLRQLPPGDAVKRAASSALSRMGMPLEAAQELTGLRELADRMLRAGLLFQAQAWPEAASAYAELLRDPALDATARAEATARLASASALARQRPGVPSELLAPESSAAALLQLSANPQVPGERGVPALRSAINRSRQIEQLLPEAGKN
ncbi:hypothetical protein NON00_17415 [Roseomonas sp. GC11]|uniref:hypothetical protein n=1 Tax=Roseomonas sp. GC11 TaxID=2950546 RepID=UPI00210F0BC4|nr:hypothetical protein [Roseomonas sp. GC11]MCQ4161696.1 hypothetical protein [Roseomonas sp. GC11]